MPKNWPSVCNCNQSGSGSGSCPFDPRTTASWRQFAAYLPLHAAIRLERIEKFRVAGLSFTQETSSRSTYGLPRPGWRIGSVELSRQRAESDASSPRGGRQRTAAGATARWYTPPAADAHDLPANAAPVVREAFNCRQTSFVAPDAWLTDKTSLSTQLRRTEPPRPPATTYTHTTSPVRPRQPPIASKQQEQRRSGEERRRRTSIAAS
jgi:hypothetical protein